MAACGGGGDNNYSTNIMRVLDAETPDLPQFNWPALR
jgi:hypothetical protein